MRKPLLLQSREICKGPLVHVKGLAMVCIEGMDGLDVVVVRTQEAEDEDIKRFTGDGEYVLGVIDGYVRAERVASSGGRVDVFVEVLKRGPADARTVQATD